MVSSVYVTIIGLKSGIINYNDTLFINILYYSSLTQDVCNFFLDNVMSCNAYVDNNVCTISMDRYSEREYLPFI